MMYLLQSWKESLSLFIPKNFKLFLLVTLKSTLELYGNLIYFFWWLIFSVFVFLVGLYYPAWATSGFLWHVCAEILLAALLFVMFMLIRPSVLPKRYIYFKQHTKKTAIGFLILYKLADVIRYRLEDFALGKMVWSFLSGDAIAGFLYRYLSFRLSFIPFFILPPFVCVVLFYFDSDGGLKGWLFSIVRGLKMYFYNLPFCFVTIFIFFLVCVCLAQLSVLAAVYGMWLFIPFVLSYFKNMYVKRLHDQFNLYFANE